MGMSRCWLIIATCWWAISAVIAQVPGSHGLTADSVFDPVSNSIRMESSGSFDSNAIHNDLVLGLRRGELIDRGIRERSQAALRRDNRFRQEPALGISSVGAGSPFDHPRWRPMISVGHHDLLGIRFTRDVYDLTFFGNKAFEGSTAHLAPSAYEQQRFQTLGFGIQDQRTSSFLRIELVMGQSLSASRLRTADLYTAPEGVELDAAVNGNYWRNDTASTTFGSINGSGLAISGRWMRPVPIGQRKSWLSFQVDDLGFIRWRNALSITKDSTIAYQGITVENIFDFPDLVLGEEEILDSLGILYERASITRPTPFRMKLSWTMALGPKWFAAATADQRYLPGYAPSFTLQATRKLGRAILLSGMAGFGGFGGVRVGLGFFTTLGRNFSIELQSRNVIGLVVPQAQGMAAGVALFYRW